MPRTELDPLEYIIYSMPYFLTPYYMVSTVVGGRDTGVRRDPSDSPGGPPLPCPWLREEAWLSGTGTKATVRGR